VDLADPVAKANAEIPDNCPFCLEEIDEDAGEETDPKRRKARKLKAPSTTTLTFVVTTKTSTRRLRL
jgi:hypothetical protein